MEEETYGIKILEMKKKDLIVGCNSVDKSELVINILEEIWEPKQDCCIYRVPECIRELNPKAYTPQLVSIGPLHRGETNLAFMEKHKKRYAKRFCKRCGLEKWKRLEAFVKDNIETIFNCYDDTAERKSDDFQEMVLLDAVFIIEFLLIKGFFLDQSDILFKKSYMQNGILMDILLLENQLPYFLLENLYKIACEDLVGCPLLYLCPVNTPMYYNGFWETLDNYEGLMIKHLNDLQRNASFDPHELDKKQQKGFDSLPTTTRLNQSSLKFKPSNASRLLDIKFKSGEQLLPLFKTGELHMPIFNIDDNTRTIILNIMALEQCHYPSHTYFCNYIHILDKLIDTKEDAGLLIEKGIIENYLESDEAVANVINEVTKNIMVSESPYYDIAEYLNSHYNNRWNHAKAILANMYFSNPWRTTATIAAVVLLVLTVVQTIFSILQVTLPSKS